MSSPPRLLPLGRRSVWGRPQGQVSGSWADFRGGDAVGTGAIAVDTDLPQDLPQRIGQRTPRRAFEAMTILVDRGPVTGTDSDPMEPTLADEDRARNAIIPNFQWSSPFYEYVWVQKERRSIGRRWADSINRIRERSGLGRVAAERLEELLRDAKEEAPGVEQPISLGSLLTLEVFFRDFNVAIPPALSLSPRGNLYARWRDETGRVVGVEMLERNSVVYVILDTQAEGRQDPVYGSGGWPRIHRMLGALDVARLLNGER